MSEKTEVLKQIVNRLTDIEIFLGIITVEFGAIIGLLAVIATIR